MTRIRRLTVGTLIALTLLGFFAGPALAHTGFESSDPLDGATLDQPVEIITLVFTGEAEPAGEGFQVLDPTGDVREPTEATTTDGRTWRLRFDPPIGGGVSGVRWMVKAPDAHPIDGSFSFAAGGTATTPRDESSPVGELAGSAVLEAPAVSDTGSLEAFLDTADDPTSGPRRIGLAGRVIALSGTLVGLGALVFAAAVMRGAHRDVRHVLHWVRRAGLLVMVGALVEFVGQLGVEGGGDWSVLFSPSKVAGVVASSFGVAVALRITGGLALSAGARLHIADAVDAPDPVVAIRELVGVGAGPGNDVWEVAHDAPRQDGSTKGAEPYVHHGDHAWHPTVDSGGAIVGALALLAAYLFDGHTVTKGDRLFTGLIDIVHVAGGAVWVGGVLMITAILWRRHREGRELRALQLAVRFSVVATMALVAVGGAGLLLTVVVLDNPSELWATEWGRILMLKMLVVAIATAAGGYNHKVLIPRMASDPDDPSLTRQFRTIVTAEAATLVAVVVITAFLVGAAS